MILNHVYSERTEQLKLSPGGSEHFHRVKQKVILCHFASVCAGACWIGCQKTL